MDSGRSELNMRYVPTVLVPWRAINGIHSRPCPEVVGSGEYSIYIQKPLSNQGRFGNREGLESVQR